MKHKMTALGIALLLSTVFLSTFVTSASAAQYIRDYSGAHFTMGGGLTFGGDTLGTVYYSSGDSADITAGGLIHIYAGLMYHFYDSPIAGRLALGYHFDQANARNGTATFDRTTLEAVPFYYLLPYSRIGAGLTLHMSPTLDTQDFGQPNVDFKDATGLVLEYGYHLGGAMWLDVRYVSIKYELKHPEYYYNTGSADGSHLGLYISAEF